MPIYEYNCRKCGDFEAMQKISAAPLKHCPTCRGKVTKLISSTSFQLKGSGWYVTDYARKEAAGGGKSKSEDKGKSEDKKTEAGTTSETKAEPAKAEPKKDDAGPSAKGGGKKVAAA